MFIGAFRLRRRAIVSSPWRFARRRIEPDVSTERVRSNEFRVCWRGLSLTHCLGDSSEGLLFCGLLKMVTFDGDVGIVFVEAYNYLSDLDI